MEYENELRNKNRGYMKLIVWQKVELASRADHLPKRSSDRDEANVFRSVRSAARFHCRSQIIRLEKFYV